MEINAWNALRCLLNEEVLSRWSWVLGTEGFADAKQMGSWSVAATPQEWLMCNTLNCQVWTLLQN
jgi:hypothetical protein